MTTKTATAAPDISAIDQHARQYADAQMALDSLTNDLRRQIDQVVREHWPRLRAATTRAAERYEALYALVSESRDAFDKPKTRILHGVRVGFRKSKDSVQILNAENTVALIKRHLADQADVLISTTERPVQSAIEQLEPDDLKLIGCKRVTGGDEPVAAIAETELDKVVQALMKSAIEKAEAAS